MFTRVALAMIVAATVAVPTAQAQSSRATAVLHFQIIEADGFTARDPAIQDVEKALRSLFKFNGYRLAADAMVRVTSGSKFEQTVVGEDETTTFVIQGEIGEILEKPGAGTIPMRVELWAGHSIKALTTSVIVPFGQTVVVGTAKPIAKRAALILVVRPTAN